MPRKIRQLIQDLKKAGFIDRGGKGCHRNFIHSNGTRITISGKTGDDAKKYQERELEQILEIALKTVGLVSKIMPRSEGTQIRPKPGLELGAPEIRVIPDRTRLADNGVTARELGDTIDAFNDGLRITEITVGSKRVDLMIKGVQDDITETQGINNLPVVTSSGKIFSPPELIQLEPRPKTVIESSSSSLASSPVNNHFWPSTSIKVFAVFTGSP